MKLTDIERKTIVGLEYEKSLSFLKQIDDIAAMNFWDTAANRMYYAIFHAVLALGRRHDKGEGIRFPRYI